ncbi:MAG: hypothetical protein IKX00_03940 [Bacilli bacterium]|nr:hypothetical protein [Bacilli bacterium]
MYLYKESDILDEFTKEEANLLRNSDININSDICELKKEISYLVNKEKDIDIKNMYEDILNKIIKLEDNIDNKYTRVIFVEPDYTSSVIDYCISDLNDFLIGDEVFYKRKYDAVEGIVKEVGYYKDYNLPKHQDELYVIKEITYRSSIDIDN